MSTTEGRVSAAELRRRVRANQALQAKTQELAAADVLSKRQAAQAAADAKEAADLAAREAVAAALRLFDNNVELVSELLEVPTEELEREAKPVTAARAKEVITALRARAERPRPRRSRPPRPAEGQPTTPAAEHQAVATVADGQADAA
ncbi:hypothetical protein [Streptomyces sp. GS7]|uniref:hypothetical protein n=1 Tax=Streptomyces sp. GS7 TaxID=2692234 RepID=UPI0013179333|nr:hypothetical protein [Streptomyces sp. GS7]QHC26401.1 hypothetical protein GR130_38565 [Streptomyces sp. GS7]